MEEKLPIAQGKLVMGFRSGTAGQDDPAAVAAMRMMTDMFGVGTLFPAVYCGARTDESLLLLCRTLCSFEGHCVCGQRD